ncbi:MAG: hypothetical protein HZC40_01330 [Chloroflexi bacterium]|nr:hypothetical protein [Chloroflexota bacterium]
MNNLDLWIQQLESSRFDITRREPLQAIKEYDAQNAAHITVDVSGQIRFTLTRMVGDTRGEKRQSRAGRAYQVFVEQNAITIAHYRLREGDDLAAVVNEIEKEIVK